MSKNHFCQTRASDSLVKRYLSCLCIKGGGGGGGGRNQAYHFGKKDFELGVSWEGQETSLHFEDSFGSIRAILPM